MSAARALAGAGALLGLGGLLLQYILLHESMTAEGAGPLDVLWRFYGYFTLLTNTLVTLLFARAALRDDARGLNAPHVELMAVTSILFVCAVYNVLLASRWNPQEWQLVADVIVHQAVPGLFALYWLARPHGRIGWADAGFAALWPFAYAAYGLTRGAFDGFYPYFFMNPTMTPWAQVAVNMAGLVAVFGVGALAMVALDRWLARRVKGA